MTNYGPASQTALAATAVTGNQFDGVTVFRGVLLGSGPVADLLPEIWDGELGQYRKFLSNPDETTAALQERIISEIGNRDSTFFERFGNEIQSGDHLRIQRALNEGGSRILEVVTTIDPESGSLGSRDGTDCHGCRCWDCYVDISVLAYAIAVAVAFVVWIAFAVFTPGTKDPSSQLQREMWIDLVATRLAAQT